MKYNRIINGINHNPVFKLEGIMSHFEGEPLQYVCTSNFHDFFFRPTPHPKFGNKFVGVKVHEFDPEKIVIVNADKFIEDSIFQTITDDNGIQHYSSHRHDYVSLDDGRYIDGGRDYPHTNSDGDILKVSFVDGMMYNAEEFE